MPECLVAVDGGGSKTEYLLADTSGQVLKQVTHAQTSLDVGGVGLAGFNLREGLRQLFEGLTPAKIAVLVLALAGLDTTEEKSRAENVLSQSFSTWQIGQLALLNDTQAALINGTSAAQALVIVAGTGSNCVGYNRVGKHCSVGGLGHLLADEGSGYDAGRLALKAVAMSNDGRIAPTRLVNKILAHFQVKGVRELKSVVYNPQLNKREIAALAKIVVETMRAGDRVAQTIIDYCLGQLLVNAQTVVRQLEVKEEFDLVIAGAFITNLKTEFAVKLNQTLPRAHLVVPETLPVYGGLKIAQKIYAGQNPEDFWFFK
jgi:N-acetylglucosamine kinase-like BadF-type ATPase